MKFSVYRIEHANGPTQHVFYYDDKSLASTDDGRIDILGQEARVQVAKALPELTQAVFSFKPPVDMYMSRGSRPVRCAALLDHEQQAFWLGFTAIDRLMEAA